MLVGGVDAPKYKEAAFIPYLNFESMYSIPKVYNSLIAA